MKDGWGGYLAGVGEGWRGKESHWSETTSWETKEGDQR